LSFFILKRRCRNCKEKISWQYPTIEGLTALLFLWLFLIYQKDLPFLIYSLFLVSLFIVIGTVDLKRFIILDKALIFGFLISLLYLLLNSFAYLESKNCGVVSCSFKSSLYGILFFAGIFFTIFLISSGRWLGFGDVKLSALVGLIFGLKNSINLFYLTFLFGSILAIMLISLKKVDLKSKIPLGTIISGSIIFFLITKFNFIDWLDKLSGGLFLRGLI